MHTSLTVNVSVSRVVSSVYLFVFGLRQAEFGIRQIFFWVISLMTGFHTPSREKDGTGRRRSGVRAARPKGLRYFFQDPSAALRSGRTGAHEERALRSVRSTTWCECQVDRRGRDGDGGLLGAFEKATDEKDISVGSFRVDPSRAWPAPQNLEPVSVSSRSRFLPLTNQQKKFEKGHLPVTSSKGRRYPR